MALMFIFLIPTALFAAFTYFEFFRYLWSGPEPGRVLLPKYVEWWMVVLLPLVFLSSFDLPEKNNCCTDSAVFAPGDRAGIYTLIFCCIAAYVYSTFRRRIAPPIPELLVNTLLLIGAGLNVFLSIHMYAVELGSAFCVLGTVPILLLFWMRLHRNQRAVLEELRTNERARPAHNLLHSVFRNQATATAALLLLALPLTLLFTLILYLLGQEPDTLSRAFSETYKHGFSRLDHECANVDCGGHYLCSVAALGHPRLVRPLRYGWRRGGRIICNRQLLVSNAFEELVAERAPSLHRAVRRRYDRVGSLIHRHYGIFRVRLVSDAVYLLMKPLEWSFLFVLYCCDHAPERRIARQYREQR
ncbi:DUF6688 domain-containing protein [Flaviaesturariibacter amylovorans]|uniref:Uncharacterized protein n=1 Tax=Flaviaesturariibacter amylovorans TaxID=1084520 RepID=A0ABP8GR85_9BACT